MELKDKGYQVTYDPTNATIICAGTFRLAGKGYAPISDLLNDVAEAKPSLMTLDLEKLEYLNCFGITVLFRFVMRVNKLKASQLVVKGNKKISWQRQSLRLFPRLMRSLKLELN
jgi:hypothetical protein